MIKQLFELSERPSYIAWASFRNVNEHSLAKELSNENKMIHTSSDNENETIVSSTHVHVIR